MDSITFHLPPYSREDHVGACQILFNLEQEKRTRGWNAIELGLLHQVERHSVARACETSLYLLPVNGAHGLPQTLQDRTGQKANRCVSEVASTPYDRALRQVKAYMGTSKVITLGKGLFWSEIKRLAGRWVDSGRLCCSHRIVLIIGCIYDWGGQGRVQLGEDRTRY